MRKFNTSGPNIKEEHYTVERTKLLEHGLELVRNDRYFNIWAPRQTGKSTYFMQLARALKGEGYKVAYINFENYKRAPIDTFLDRLTEKINKFWGSKHQKTNLTKLFYEIEKNDKGKCVLIIDEVEGINEKYLGEFLHSIRNAFHSRERHCLKSVILVGISNIVGVAGDNASPYNIADDLNIPYFTNNEVFELLGQHEKETGQLFEEKVKEKICQITANQPGLVNGFAKKLIEDNPDKKVIGYNDYLKVEDWYLTEAIDKNLLNLINKANEERAFVERLIFTEDMIPFNIDRRSIKPLFTNGIIENDKDGYVTFRVPFYKKLLYYAFYPYTKGEQREIRQTIYTPEYFDGSGQLKIEKLIDNFKEYGKRRGFNVFREKDENGNYQSIKEAALIYNFETYIHAVIRELKGKIYREANTGLGKSDMVINISNEEFLIET